MEEEKLLEVANALAVSVEAIKKISEEGVINYFNTFTENDFSNSQGANFAPYSSNNYTFNPLDKVVEIYERLVQAEKDKVEYLEKLLKTK
jgi:hypothetical protein